MTDNTPRRRRNGSGSDDLQAITITGDQMPPGLEEALLAALGVGRPGTFVSDDDIQYHPGTAIVLPEGKPLEWAHHALARKIAEQEEEHTFRRIFPYRPWDGANAASNVLHTMFGIVVGKATRTMFGSRPPEFRTIDVAHNAKREIPWGELEIPALPGASMEFESTSGRNGPVFVLSVTSPKKHKKVIEEFFDAIDRELKVHSIYRGKALEGAHDLSFLDLTGFHAEQIVFADDVQATLDAALFSVMRHPLATKRAGMKLRRALLVYGPFGTGKSSLGLITAQEAVAHGWTFLSAKAGKDNLRDVLQTAKLYQRAVVFVEDIDAHQPKANDLDGMSELLDLFDGVAVKDTEIILVATTNHIETVTAGLLRPGRLDYVIEIAALDRSGTEKLIRAVVPTDLLGEVDFDAVYAAMPEFQPAWVKAVADRAQSFAIARTAGEGTYLLTTHDLVGAARSLHPQLDLMRAASEGVEVPELGQAFGTAVDTAVRGVLTGSRFADSDDDETIYTLVPAK